MKRHLLSASALLVMIVFAFGSVDTSNVNTGGNSAPPTGPATDGTTPNASTASASIISARLVPFRSPTTGQQMQMVITTWKNTGNTPVRAIDATFTFRDKNKEVIGSYEYTLYAAFDTESGVLPGNTYTTPTGEGFLFPNPNVTAASVEVSIIRVQERSGM